MLTPEYNARFKATAEKVKSEALEEAFRILEEAENDKNYFGDENVVKIRRHNGEIIYYISEATMQAILECCTLQRVAMDAAINLMQRNYQGCTKKEYSILEYIACNKMPKEVLQSIEKAVKGDFLADFWYNKERKDAEKLVEEAKTELLTKKWGF